MFKGFMSIDNISGNAIGIGGHVVCVNPKVPIADKLYEKVLHNPRVHIHAFYSNPHDTDDLPELIKRLDTKLDGYPEDAKVPKPRIIKLYIHHDKANRDMGIMIQHLIPDTMTVHTQIIPESKPVKFHIPGRSSIFVNGDVYSNCHVVQELVVTLSMYRASVDCEIHMNYGIYDSGSFTSAPTGNAAGAIVSVEQQMHPEFFRNGIIARFKKNTPENILKSFKNDDDIWDFITYQGEWSAERSNS